MKFVQTIRIKGAQWNAEKPHSPNDSPVLVQIEELEVITSEDLADVDLRFFSLSNGFTGGHLNSKVRRILICENCAYVYRLGDLLLQRCEILVALALCL
jgi:hypothetical protein